jgi:hypothetical protein
MTYHGGVLRRPLGRALVGTAFVLALLASVACGDAEPECTRDEECEAQIASGYACNDEGECYECDHGDPAPDYIETPAPWDPEAFVSGEDLGLDPGLAYLPIAEDELALGGDVSEIYLCGVVLVGGEVTDNDRCATLTADDVLTRDGVLYVPVAPSEWLLSEPVNGIFYQEITIYDENDDAPIYYC